MSFVSKIFSAKFLRMAVMTFAVCVFAGYSAPADAHKRHRTAYVVGTHFPFVSGYRYHPSGYWYVARRADCRYDARYYSHRRGVGYVYVGPNHGYYRHHRVRNHYAHHPRHSYGYVYHYEPRNRGIFTAHGGFRWHH
ncbi:hypothetical protein ACKTEK_08760 [Tepidamorphus sp. 3E244]|uniref:hypothetical protein n=1 Tax=Tepidamorphus sp. 3E244 TaxID=3385498 RepID=UPI0038FC151D